MSGDGLFGRFLGRVNEPLARPENTALFGCRPSNGAGSSGRSVDGQRRRGNSLAVGVSNQQPRPLLDYIVPGSTQALEGEPAEWVGQSLDLDFVCIGQRVLRTRGWVQPHPDGWLLQVLDISDLLHERELGQYRVQCQQLTRRVSEHVGQCGPTLLPEVMRESLQQMAQHWHVPCMALALADESTSGWTLYSAWHALDAPQLWTSGQTLGSGLSALGGHAPHRLTPQHGMSGVPGLSSLFGNAEGFFSAA